MTSIGIDELTHKEIKTLSKVHKKSIVDFMRCAAVYFKQTGIDPEQAIIESPQKAIKELTRRVEQIIGVVKAQQQDMMNPLLEQLTLLVKGVETLLGDAPKESTFKTVLSRTEEMIEADQTHHMEQLQTQHKYYKGQADLQQQTNLNTIKKLDEVLAGMDKMAATLKVISNR